MSNGALAGLIYGRGSQGVEGPLSLGVLLGAWRSIQELDNNYDRMKSQNSGYGVLSNLRASHARP